MTGSFRNPAAHAFVKTEPPADRRAPLSFLAAVLAAITNVGCGKILGVDEYRVRGSGAAPVCADPLTAPGSTGACEKLGPACAAPGFVADAAGGCRAVLPQSDCVSADGSPMGAFPSRVDCGSLFGGCETDPPRPLTFLGSSFYYVNPTAAPGGDGSSSEHAFASIGDALRAPTHAQVLLLHSGVYRENVDLTYPVALRGACPSSTRIVGTSPSVPVVHIGESADGASLSLLDVSGDPASTAVAIERYRGQIRPGIGVQLSAVWIHDVRQGISIDDSGDVGQVTLTQVLLERTSEHAITIRGSSVSITETAIRDVGSPSLSPAIESAAIDAHPSRHAPHQATVPGQTWDPWNAPRSKVSVADSLIERAPIGVLFEGSSAKLSTTVIRNTTTGVVSRWRPLGPIPGDVAIDHSLIEQSAEVGVQVWNAHTTISETTIRATGADCAASDVTRPVGAYPGNAVRARFDHVPVESVDGGATFDQTSQALTIDHSLLDSSKQAGVHVEGGALALDHTLVRGTSTEACTGSLGDGLMVYSHPGFPPATVSITTTRVAGSGGPGLAAFGELAPPLSFRGAVLDGNAAGIQRDSPTIGIDGEVQCGSGTTVDRCVPEDEKPVRSVSVATCPSKSELDCAQSCFEGMGSPGAIPPAPIVVEFLREPRIAPAVSDANGCTTVGGLEGGRVYAFGTFSEAFIPAHGPLMFPEGAAWAPVRARIDLVEYGTLGGATALPSQGFGADGLDLALALSNGVYVCGGAAPPVDPHAPVSLPSACPTGVQEWTPTLVNAPPGTLGPNSTSETLVPAGPRQPGTNIGGLWYYFNVAPGDYELRLQPGGGSGECSPYFFSTSVVTAVPFGHDASSTFTDLRLRAEAGYTNAAGYLYCTP